MAEGDLHFVVLHRAFIDLDRSLVLQHDLFLIVERLLGNAVFRPRIAITLQVHLGLFQDVGVAFKRPLSLHELRLEGPRIDVDQRLALANQLAFRVVDLAHQSRDFTGNRVGINRSDRANRIQIHADVSLLRGCGRKGDGTAESAPRRSGALAVAVMTQHQPKNNPENQQDRDPHERPLPLGLVRIGLAGGSWCEQSMCASGGLFSIRSSGIGCCSFLACLQGVLVKAVRLPNSLNLNSLARHGFPWGLRRADLRSEHLIGTSFCVAHGKDSVTEGKCS